MKRKRDKDEYLEQLRYMPEDKKDSLAKLKTSMGESFNEDVFKELLSDGTIKLGDKEDKVLFAEAGKKMHVKLLGHTG